MNTSSNTFARFFYFMVILTTMGCGQSQVEIISADKLKELQSDGVTVVDIRTPSEYEGGHIPGVLHMDYLASDFSDKMVTLDKSKPLVIYCASGGRSAKASKMLSEQGFNVVYNYSGGFNDWKQRGEKVEK